MLLIAVLTSTRFTLPNLYVYVCIRHSPMLGCLSRRQIRASRSNFWWSVETTTQTLFTILRLSKSTSNIELQNPGINKNTTNCQTWTAATFLCSRNTRRINLWRIFKPCIYWLLTAHDFPNRIFLNRQTVLKTTGSQSLLSTISPGYCRFAPKNCFWIHKTLSCAHPRTYS